MYLRHTTVKKGGRTHTYWRLVRSVRHGRKVKQQLVAHLGELDSEGRARAAALARHMMGTCEPGELFEAPKAAAQALPVRIEQVSEVLLGVRSDQVNDDRLYRASKD